MSSKELTDDEYDKQIINTLNSAIEDSAKKLYDNIKDEHAIAINEELLIRHFTLIYSKFKIMNCLKKQLFLLRH